MRLIRKRVRNDPKNREYMDLALEPVIENEIETLALFQSEAAKKFVDKQHRFEKMRQNVKKPLPNKGLGLNSSHNELTETMGVTGEN